MLAKQGWVTSRAGRRLGLVGTLVQAHCRPEGQTWADLSHTRTPLWAAWARSKQFDPRVTFCQVKAFLLKTEVPTISFH